MDRKAVIILLVKIFPFYVIVFIAWQIMGLSTIYHGLIGEFLSLLYATFSPQGLIKGVEVRDADFFVKLLIRGRHLGLQVVAADITGNIALLLTLYIASPIKHNLKKFLIYFLSSLLLIFLIHVLTLAALIKFALASNPGTVGLLHPGFFSLKVIPIYKNFYEIIGMYLVVLVLWFPYIMSYILKQPNIETPDSKNKGAG